MKFFILKSATNTIETGPIYPQVQKMSFGYNYEAFNSVHALSRFLDKFPDFSPNLDHFILNDKSKLTDLLSVAVAYGGLLISNKFKNLFEKFSLPLHIFYPAKVLRQKEFFEYHWMHIICDLTDDVDYKKSNFIAYYNYAHNLGLVPVNSKEDLVEKRQKLKNDNPDKAITIWAEQIVLNTKAKKNMDLFKIGTFDSSIYITEVLKRAIITSKITGCEITDALNLQA